MARESLEHVEVDTYCDDMEVVHAHWIEGQTDNPKIHNIRKIDLSGVLLVVQRWMKMNAN